MPSVLDFDELMNGMRAGAPNALCQLFEEFKDQLVRTAESYLGNRARRRLDVEDLALSVLLAFSQRLAEHHLDIQDWNHLKNLLGLMMRWECSRQIRYLSRAMRDFRRERLLPPSRADVEDPWEGFSHEPTPEEAATLADTVEHLLCGFTEQHRTILELYLQGARPTEISASLGCTSRMVYRVVYRARSRLRREHPSRLHEGDSGGSQDAREENGPEESHLPA